MNDDLTGRYAADVSNDLASVEREICRIPEVRAARIVADQYGRPVEVHVLATPGKHAKQLARDIQSVAMASMGVEIDHRIISIVQLDDGAATSYGPRGGNGRDEDEDAQAAPIDEAAFEADEPRILVDSVVAVRKGLQCTAEVALRRGEEIIEGVAEGSSAASAMLRLVAQATVDALRRLEPAAAAAHVETATITQVGQRAVAVTTVVLLIPPNEEVVTGSAPVRGGGDHEAVARSVLDATNRRLAQLRAR